MNVNACTYKIGVNVKKINNSYCINKTLKYIVKTDDYYDYYDYIYIDCNDTNIMR